MNGKRVKAKSCTKACNNIKIMQSGALLEPLCAEKGDTHTKQMLPSGRGGCEHEPNMWRIAQVRAMATAAVAAMVSGSVRERAGRTLPQTIAATAAVVIADAAVEPSWADVGADLPIPLYLRSVYTARGKGLHIHHTPTTISSNNSNNNSNTNNNHNHNNNINTSNNNSHQQRQRNHAQQQQHEQLQQ